LIIAYSHCIAHGINMTTAMKNQKAAVESGQWLLYRYHPDRSAEGHNPLKLDSRKPRIPLTDYLYLENRFKMLLQSRPDAARQLAKTAQQDVYQRRMMYEYLAADHLAPQNCEKTGEASSTAARGDNQTTKRSNDQ